MKKKKRKTVLFIDNCTAHNDPLYLKNVQLEYLPQTQLFGTLVDVYLAMIMANKAWRNVSAKTIGNCFKKAGFVKQAYGEENENEEKENPIPFGVSSEQWNRLAIHMDVIETYFSSNRTVTCA